MRGSWLVFIRRVHTFLSIFFAPMLLMFIVTGFWQTAIPEEKAAEPGFLHQIAEDFSRVHTDSYFPKAGVADPSTVGFKILVVALCVALVVSIVLGLILAWNHAKNGWWSVLALVLGIVVPALILWAA